MWLSIVAFAAAVGMINDIIARGGRGDVSPATFNRAIERVSRNAASSLANQGTGGLERELSLLPQVVRDHVYILDEFGAEILGRDEEFGLMSASGRPARSTRITDGQGSAFFLYTFSRVPPQSFLAPGPRGTALRLFAAAFISAFLSYYLARSITSPLKRIRDTSRQIAGGDLNARVGKLTPSRRDEIGGLAEDFDNMASRLQTMQQANRRLLRDVSHELRSPLSRLSVALEIARGKGADKLTSELDRIELESNRLEILVDEVLALLRESSESFTPGDETFDLTQLLDELAETVGYEAPEDSPGIIWSPGEPLPFKGDRELLWRAVENLLRNALRYTDPARGVVLALEAKGAGSAHITVRDFGPGVPEEEVEKIFEPFYRVHESRDRSTGGYGLGLAIAAAAIRRHKGEISAANVADGGLMVSIELPAAA